MINRSGSHLETLQLEASIQAKRAQIIICLLPSELEHEIAIGDLNSGLLTLYVAQASLATRLRFEEYSLIDALRSNPLFRGIRRIRCRVRPLHREQKTVVTKTIQPNTKAGSLIREFAETLANEELKRQFQQLAAKVSGIPPHDQT